MIGVALVAYCATTKLLVGPHVDALGGNRRVAELSGVRVRKTETMVYIISGFCSPVVPGGTSLMGGRGGIGGTVIGAFVIGVLVDGLVVMGYSSFLQNIIKGVVIVLAVFIDIAQIKMPERVALQRHAALATGKWGPAGRAASNLCRSVVTRTRFGYFISVSRRRASRPPGDRPRDSDRRLSCLRAPRRGDRGGP